MAIANQKPEDPAKPRNGAALKVASLAKRTFGFRTLLNFVVLAVVLTVGIVMLKAVEQNLRLNKTRDVWAILFLELEHRARDLSEKLVQLGPGAHAVTRCEISSEDELACSRNRELNLTKLPDLGIERRSDLTYWNLFEVKGVRYVGRLVTQSGKEFLEIFHVAGQVKLDSANSAAKDSKVYIASRQGTMIYSNSPDVDQTNFLSRVLVQKFIMLPVWQGQLELTDNHNRGFYGYFTEVPGTNLVVFAETSKDVVVSAVNAEVRHLTITLLTALGLAIITLQWPLYVLLKPVTSLVDVVNRVALGDFDAQPARNGFGEIGLLSEAFGDMTSALKEREQVIRSLMIEQQDKVRLEAELALAKSIQDNLLPIAEIPEGAKLQLAAAYRPASEVAGDWYGYFFDETTGTTAIAIVDISGHGAGASMFTAIAASLFEELHVRFSVEKDARRFFTSLNHQLIRYGRSNWTASAQLLLHNAVAGQVTILNAGHPAPVINKVTGGPGFQLMGKMASTPLGFGSDFKLAEVNIPFGPNNVIMLYTDGLSECRSPAGQVMGSKRLIKSVNAADASNAGRVIDQVMETANAYAEGHPMRDDICIIVARGL